MDHSPLNKLSPEIRNIIYGLVFTTDDKVYGARLAQGTNYDDVQPSLTRVCKQVRSEHLAIFYASSKFTLRV